MHQHICKTIQEKTSLQCKKKQKAPAYTPEEEKKCKTVCRRLYGQSAGKDFVIDDDKYFTLFRCNMPGNSFYYVDTSNNTCSPQQSHQVKSKQRFKAKLMLWMAVSQASIAKPYIVPSGLAVNKEVYIRECLQKCLLPFIQDNHPPHSYLFWPDKASSHHIQSTQEFLFENNVTFVPQKDNPTNLPQCCLIDDLFSQLSQAVYQNG